MMTLVYIGLGVLALLSLVALGRNAGALPYLGIAVLAILIYARFR